MTIKKRFLVFGGKCFYAAGGFNDLVASFDSAIDAVVYCEQTNDVEIPLADWQIEHNGDPNREYDEVPGSIEFEWYQVFDSTTNRIIASSTREPLGADERKNNVHGIKVCVQCLECDVAINSYNCVNCENI